MATRAWLFVLLACASCRHAARPSEVDPAPWRALRAEADVAPRGLVLAPFTGDDDTAVAACIACHAVETPGELARYQQSAHAQLGQPVRCVDCHGRTGHGEYVAFGYRFKDSTLDADGITRIGDGRQRVYYEWHPTMVVRAMQSCQRSACHARIYQQHMGVNRRVTPGEAMTPFHGMVRFDHGISSWNDTMMSSFGLAMWESWGTEMFREGCVRCHDQVLAWNVAGPSPDQLTANQPVLRELIDRQAEDIPSFAHNRFPGVDDESLLLSRCVECHVRHEFSRSAPTNANACGKCHSGPDHPQIEAWQLSRHRVVTNQRGPYSEANPAGGPTCATCHFGPDHSAAGAVDHDLTRGLAWNYKPESARWRQERSVMLDRCSECHARQYARTQLDSADRVARRTTNALMAEIRALCQAGYDRGLIKAAPNSFFGKPMPFAPTFFHASPWLTGKYRVSTFENVCWDAWRERGLASMETGAWHFSPQFTQWLGIKPADEFIGRLRELLDVK